MKRVVAVVVACLAASVVVAGVPAQGSAAKFLAGDVDLDGIVSQLDVLAIMDWDAGRIALSNAQLAAADMNRDGLANLDDAALLLSRVMTDDKVMRRVEFVVNPVTGIERATISDPLQAVRDRLAGDKLHEENPPELDWQNTPPDTACTDCGFCLGGGTYNIVSAWFWDDPGGNRDGVSCTVFADGHLTSGNVTGFVDNWDCSELGGIWQQIDTTNGNKGRMSSDVTINNCTSFIYRYDLWVDVESGSTEE